LRLKNLEIILSAAHHIVPVISRDSCQSTNDRRRIVQNAANIAARNDVWFFAGGFDFSLHGKFPLPV
jgi:hypothetical protein